MYTYTLLEILLHDIGVYSLSLVLQLTMNTAPGFQASYLIRFLG